MQRYTLILIPIYLVKKKMAVRKRPIEDTRRYNMRIPQIGRFVLEIGQEGPHLRSKIAVVHAEASAKIKD